MRRERKKGKERKREGVPDEFTLRKDDLNLRILVLVKNRVRMDLKAN